MRLKRPKVIMVIGKDMIASIGRIRVFTMASTTAAMMAYLKLITEIPSKYWAQSQTTPPKVKNLIILFMLCSSRNDNSVLKVQI